MGLFQKKEKTILERQTAVNQRIDTLHKQIANKEKSITDARENLSTVLGNLALEQSEANEDAVKRAKHVLGRAEDGLDDLKTMLTALEAEKAKLETERLEVLVREAPGRAVQTAANFNLLLERAIEITGLFREVHAGLLKAESEYHAILKDRNIALATLGRIEPLELPPGAGLGKLATAPVPYRQVFQTPDINRPEVLLATLVQYVVRVEGVQKQKAANPHFGEDEGPKDFGGFGEIGAPNRDKSFRQVFEPGQQQ